MSACGLLDGPSEVPVTAPRDVIERATKVWVPVIADNFPAGSINPQWTAVASPGASIGIGPSGGLQCVCTTGLGTPNMTLTSAALPATNTWSATTSIQNISPLSATSLALNFYVSESVGSTEYYIRVLGGTAPQVQFNSIFPGGGAGPGAVLVLPIQPSYDLRIESDGEWMWGYCNGTLISCFRRLSTSTTTLKTQVEFEGDNVSMTVAGVLVEALQPFLMPGCKEGDYVVSR